MHKNYGLIYLHLLTTGCFMKISLQSLELNVATEATEVKLHLTLRTEEKSS